MPWAHCQLPFSIPFTALGRGPTVPGLPREVLPGRGSPPVFFLTGGIAGEQTRTNKGPSSPAEPMQMRRVAYRRLVIKTNKDAMEGPLSAVPASQRAWSMPRGHPAVGTWHISSGEKTHLTLCCIATRALRSQIIARTSTRNSLRPKSSLWTSLSGNCYRKIRGPPSMAHH